MKKEAHADSRRKDDADFLIKGMGLAPLDQLVFSVEISVKNRFTLILAEKGAQIFY